MINKLKVNNINKCHDIKAITYTKLNNTFKI